ncbi:MAG: LytTR family DNA-binding domain-containing protein [Butyrivibrio sp.]|nr:LytTR family DNA-binding domain-containing protein [Butyrivibrio sp.]
MIKIAVVDDDSGELKKLSDMFTRLGGETGQELSVETFTDSASFLKDYDKSYSMLCLDIELNGEDDDDNGIELARKIRQVDSDVMIIFITNLAQMAIKGYEVRAFDFIVKPVIYGDFAMKMRSALGFCLGHRVENFKVQTEGGFVMLSSDKLYYIEVSGHYLFYHTKNQVYKQKGALKEIESKINDLPFKRCNNCYLINLKYVDGVDKDDVIVGGERLKISRPKKREFLQAIAEYMGGKML